MSDHKELVETVARALSEHMGFDPDDRASPDEPALWESHVPPAKAAIEAIYGAMNKNSFTDLNSANEHIEFLEEEVTNLRAAVDEEIENFIDGRLMAYVDKLVDMGLWGNSRVEVLQYQIRDNICRAVSTGLLKTMTFKTDKDVSTQGN